MRIPGVVTGLPTVLIKNPFIERYGAPMRWLLSACFLGGLSALFRRWQWPFADGLNVAGFGVLVLGFVLWLKDSRDYWPGARSQGMDTATGFDWTPPDVGAADVGDGGGGGD